MSKVALICGVAGQDGSYLAKLLLQKGYDVYGSSRSPTHMELINLKKLGIETQIKKVSLNPEDIGNCIAVIEALSPDEVYYLAGQSSVGLSFEQPVTTFQSSVLGVLNILESCRVVDNQIRFYHAGSSEVFGNTFQTPANELTSFNPLSPYAVAKASAFWLVNNYRRAYDLFCCTGLLFNHESSLRPERFVTQKIISAAQRISNGSKEKLTLGRMDIYRDWGWAPEYVDAMWRMLQIDEPEDFVIATGLKLSLENFVAYTFETLGLDWKKYVVQDPLEFRPLDIKVSYGDFSKAKRILGWEPTTRGTAVIRAMLEEVI